MRIFSKPSSPELTDRSEVLPDPETVGQVALSPMVEEPLLETIESHDLTSLPEVKDIIYKAETRHLVTDEFFQQKIESSQIDRGLKRKLISNGLPVLGLEVSKALAVCLAEPGVYQRGYTPDRDLVGRAKLAAYLQQFPPFLKAGLITEDIFKAAVELEPLLVTYRQKSNQLTERLAGDGATDRQTRYLLAKQISEKLKDEQSSERKWLSRLLFNPELGKDNLPAQLLNDIKIGGFDDLIAREIVLGEASGEVLDILDLMKKTLGRELSQDEIEKFCKLYDAWPQEAYKKLSDYRSSLVDNIQRASSETQTDLRRLFGNLYSNGLAEDNFTKAMERFIRASKNLKGPVATDRVPQIARKQLSGQAVHTSRMAPPVRPSAQEVRREVSNELVFVDGFGNIVSTPGKLDLISSEVTENYKGAPGIETDIKRIFDYLKNLDLRDHQELKRARLAKLEEAGGIWVKDNGDQKQLPLYRFKPVDATGLPLKTAEMKRHRVYLVMLNQDTLGILGIVHRDKSNQFLAKFGFDSGQGNK